MKLLEKLWKKNPLWEGAYQGNPGFYMNHNGLPFGTFSFTEGARSSFPINPKPMYKVEGEVVDDWRMVLVSTTKNAVIGELNYDDAIEKLADYALDVNSKYILVKGLTVEELEGLLD